MRAQPFTGAACPECSRVWATASSELLTAARGLVRSELIDPRHRPAALVRALLEDFHAEGHPRPRS